MPANLLISCNTQQLIFYLIDYSLFITTGIILSQEQASDKHS